MSSGWMRWLTVVSAAVLLGACGSGSSSPDSAELVDAGQSPGAEITAVDEPKAEATGPEVGARAGSAGVSVQLPGVGADGPSLSFLLLDRGGCAELDLTSAPATEGVSVVIDRIELPAAVEVLDGGCGGLPPCLSGVGLTATQDACSVPVRWRGVAIPGDARLEVTGATVLCPDRESCEAAAERVAGDGVIDLDAEEGAPSDSTDSGGEDPVDPFGEEDGEPGDGASTAPTDGAGEPEDEGETTSEGDTGTEQPADDFTG